jgi:hypothetical protein
MTTHHALAPAVERGRAPHREAAEADRGHDVLAEAKTDVEVFAGRASHFLILSKLQAN